MRLPTPGILTTAVLEFLVAGSLIVGATITWRYIERGRSATVESSAAAREAARSGARSIDSLLQRVEPIARSVADRIGRGEIRDSLGLAAALSGALGPGRDSLVLAIGAAYRPYAGPGHRRFFSLRVRHADGKLIPEPIRYDYTAPSWSWYHDPILEDSAMWVEPFYNGSTGAAEVDYAVPFHLPGRDDPAGVVVLTCSVERIRALVGSLGVGRAGYAFLLSAEGQYLAHPRAEYLAGGQGREDGGGGGARTIFAVAWERGDTALHSLAIHATQGEAGSVRHVDDFTGEAAWIYYQPVSTPGWSVGAVFYSETQRPDADLARRDLILIVISALVLLLAVLGLVGSVLLGKTAQAPVEEAEPPEPRSQPRRTSYATIVLRRPLPVGAATVLWSMVVLAALALAGAIAAVWIAAARYPASEPVPREMLLDAAGIRQALKLSGTHCRGSEEVTGSRPVTCIPTGVLVKSFDFVAGTNITMTGYVWQRYDSPVARGTPRGFILPEAESAAVEVLDSVAVAGGELIRWTFAATFRQEFEYDKYPLDHQEMWLRLAPAGLDPGVVLVPDLSAYDVLNPVTRPGVDEGIVLPGWAIDEAFFSLRPHGYSASLGRPDAPGGRRPELYYSMELRRDFLSPFIADVVPLAVAVALLFAILVTASRRDAEGRQLGFSAMDVVLGCAALFFVIIFQHLSLRNSLRSPRIMYIEYFYFLTYFALMGVSIDALIFGARTSIRLIEFGDNLVPKLAFWPLFMGIMFVVTASIFY